MVFAINCTTELPNQFEKDGISYLQLKISNTKQQKLWSEEMKKIKRIEKFVE